MVRDGDCDDGGEGEGPVSRYDDELLSANWNPVLALLEWSCTRTLAEASRGAPQVGEDDAEAFLGRFYTLGS
jgi:hypothetical protein